MKLTGRNSLPLSRVDKLKGDNQNARPNKRLAANAPGAESGLQFGLHMPGYDPGTAKIRKGADQKIPGTYFRG